MGLFNVKWAGSCDPEDETGTLTLSFKYSSFDIKCASFYEARALEAFIQMVAMEHAAARICFLQGKGNTIFEEARQRANWALDEFSKAKNKARPEGPA